MRFRKKRATVGLDIGSKAIKAVVISNTGAKEGGAVLSNYAIRNTNGNGLSDEGIAAHVRELFNEAGITERDVHCAVSGSSVVVRYVNMKKMPPEDLRNSIRFEAAQHIPFDIKEVEMDCTILEETLTSDPRMMRVLLVAAKKDECRRITKILKLAGLNSTVIDVDSIALANSYLYGNGKESEQVPVALVNVGAKKTNVDIIDKGKPAFTRNVEIGGDGITLAIARGMNVDPQEAERLKIFGDALIQEHLRMVLDSIVRQLRTSFDYYEGIAGKAVGKIHLSGGTSMMSGFKDFISERLGLPVDVWNPLLALDTKKYETDEELKTIGPTLDVAVGLAVRGD